MLIITVILLTNSQILFIGCFSSLFGCCVGYYPLLWVLLPETTFLLCFFNPSILCLFSFLLRAIRHSLQSAFFLCRIIKLEGTLEIIQSKHFLLVFRKLRSWEVKVSCYCVWSLPIIHLQQISQTDWKGWNRKDIVCKSFSKMEKSNMSKNNEKGFTSLEYKFFGYKIVPYRSVESW